MAAKPTNPSSCCFLVDFWLRILYCFESFFNCFNALYNGFSTGISSDLNQLYSWCKLYRVDYTLIINLIIKKRPEISFGFTKKKSKSGVYNMRHLYLVERSNTWKFLLFWYRALILEPFLSHFFQLLNIEYFSRCQREIISTKGKFLFKSIWTNLRKFFGS